MTTNTYIGCSGFSERLWKGFFYPEDLPSKDYLSYYSERVNAVEVNSTFYRKPTLKTLQNWYMRTPQAFKFFIKIPKGISHIKRLKDTKAEVSEFAAHISSGLKEKLSGFLFQLPPSFHYNEENMLRVLETVDPEFLNVVEFRHESWWNEEVLNTLKQHGIVFCGVSFPKGVPDDVMVNTEDVLYYRLHGVPVLFKSEYTEEELRTLAKKMSAFEGDRYVFFNNTFGIAGIKNALFLQEILK